MVYSRHPLPINFPKLDAAYETVSSLFLPIAKLENDHISSLYFYCLTVPIELVLGCSCCIRSACAAVSGRMRLASACLSIMKMEHGYSLRPSKTPTGGREGGREGRKKGPTNADDATVHSGFIHRRSEGKPQPRVNRWSVYLGWGMAFG